MNISERANLGSSGAGVGGGSRRGAAPSLGNSQSDDATTAAGSQGYEYCTRHVKTPNPGCAGDVLLVPQTRSELEHRNKRLVLLVQIFDYFFHLISCISRYDITQMPTFPLTTSRACQDSCFATESPVAGLCSYRDHRSRAWLSS